MQDGEAIDVRHLQIEHDDVGLLVARPAQAVAAIDGLEHLVARLVPDDLLHDVAERLVVIDDQDALARQLVGAVRRSNALTVYSRDRQCKDRALTEHAFDSDRAADQFGERSRQRQAETGALHFLLQTRIDLREFLENPIMILGRDADPGIANGEDRGAVFRIIAARWPAPRRFR